MSDLVAVKLISSSTIQFYNSTYSPLKIPKQHFKSLLEICTMEASFNKSAPGQLNTEKLGFGSAPGNSAPNQLGRVVKFIGFIK